MLLTYSWFHWFWTVFLQNAPQKKENTRSATTNFGKEEVLKILVMITITFWTSGDIDPIKLNNFGSRNPIFDIPGAQTCQFVFVFWISLILSCVCVKCSNKKKATQSATTNFGKEEVLKISRGIQVFARNSRSSYIVVFPLGQRRGSQELNQNANCHIYIYI